MRTIVVPAPGHDRLASRLVSRLEAEVGSVETRRFPDGERYLRVASDIAGAHIVVAASLRDPDPQLAGLLFLADAARDLGAKRVGLAVPYLAYLRQDRRFRDGEAVTSRTFAAVLSRSFDWIATVDPHLHRYRRLSEVYSIRAVVAHAAPDLARWIAKHVADPIVIGPDGESLQWAGEVASAAGCPVAVLEKRRHGDRDVEVSVPHQDVRGRTPVLVDDIISSARTMAEAARALIEKSNVPPVCIGVHAVFAAGAEEALRSAGVHDVVTCNTIEHPTNGIDVLKAFAVSLKPLLAGV